MIWREPILNSIRDDLLGDPPEFILVKAPVKGGKSTLARQLVARLRAHQLNIVPVLLDLARLHQRNTEEYIAHFCFKVFKEQFSEAASFIGDTASSSISEINRVTAPAVASFEDVTSLLAEIMATLPVAATLVLIIDHIGSLPENLQSALLDYFRWLHENRYTNSLLRRVSVVILSTRSLRIKHHTEFSHEHSLPDLTRDEVVQFVSGAERLLDGIRFTPEAVKYLFDQTDGHAILIQTICDHAVRRISGPENLQLCHILDGVVSCFLEGQDAYISTLMDYERLESLRGTVELLIEQEPVLPWREHVPRLIEQGITKQVDNHRCNCRSPLVHTLFVSRYADKMPRITEIDGLRQSERCLVTLPQVSALLLNKSLQRKIDERVGIGMDEYATGEWRPTWESSYAEAALEILEELDPLIDECGLQFLAARYFENDVPRNVDKHTVFRLVAKVFARWVADKQYGVSHFRG